MSYIPDCRHHDAYNQKYLSEKDSTYVMGYDVCADEAECFFDNLHIYATQIKEANDGDVELLHYFEKHPELLKVLTECLIDYLEMGRDELITSMIDNMSEEDIVKAKEEVDSGSRKPYIRIKNAETGEYVFPDGDNV